FPIYGPYGHSDPMNAQSSMKVLKSSYRVREGTRPSGPRGSYDGSFVQDYEYVKGRGDLDDCNGRFGVTSEYPQGIYHYVVTGTYPYVPRGWKGSPDDSFRKRPGRFGPGGGGRRGPGGPGFGPPGGGFGPPGGPGFGPPRGPGFGPPGGPGFGPPEYQ